MIVVVNFGFRFEIDLFMQFVHMFLIIIFKLLELKIDELVDFFEIFSIFKTNQMNIFSLIPQGFLVISHILYFEWVFF